jgi:glycerol-3-phosphate dehydrogenase subunit B
MAVADVVVVGAGLAGLTAALTAADAGATVELVAKGHATTHWTSGGIDVAAPAGATTPRDGIARLAADRGHPYAALAGHLEAALAFVRQAMADEGLPYRGGLDDPLRPIPTAIGSTRPAAIVPEAQAGALAPWAPGERLVICGPAGFKDFWPSVAAAALSRPEAWHGAPEAPAEVEPLVLDWPPLGARRNLSAPIIARQFDDRAWRTATFERLARELDRHRHRATRIAFPAVLGLNDHAAVLDDATRILPAPVFEIALVPPSVPGLRLLAAFRAAIRRRGGRIVIGEPVIGVDASGRRVTAVVHSAAARSRRIRTAALVLATGGLAGGGLVGRPDGRLVEPVLGLPVEAPTGAWLAADPFDPAGHPLERAGVRTDVDLRPTDPARGGPLYDNVAVVGGLLAGQRAVAERTGDGVALASGWLAARRLAGSGAPEAASAEGRPRAGAGR